MRIVFRKAYHSWMQLPVEGGGHRIGGTWVVDAHSIWRTFHSFDIPGYSVSFANLSSKKNIALRAGETLGLLGTWFCASIPLAKTIACRCVRPCRQ